MPTKLILIAFYLLSCQSIKHKPLYVPKDNDKLPYINLIEVKDFGSEIANKMIMKHYTMLLIKMYKNLKNNCEKKISIINK